MLVADVYALQAIDFLDFVHQVRLQFFFAQHGQDIVRIERAVHEWLTRSDALALLHIDVDAARHRVFLLRAIVGYHVHFALALRDLAKFDHAIDFADDCGLMRLACFEQLDHARQTTGNVLRLGGFTRNLRQHISRESGVAVLHHQVGARGHEVPLAGFALDDDRRLPLLVRRIRHHVARQASDFVYLFMQCDAFLQVLELHRAADFGQDREGVGIPLD